MSPFSKVPKQIPNEELGGLCPAVVRAHARARHRFRRIAGRNPHDNDYGGNFTKKDPRWRLGDE